MINLRKAVVVFDLEATGTAPERDRIVEAAFLRREPDGQERTFSSLINPGMPIPPAPAPAPGQPVPTGNFNPNQPGGGTVPSANPSSGLRQIPTRSLRMPQSSAQILLLCHTRSSWRS